MILLKSLPDSYKVVQKTLLAIIDFSKVNATVIDNVHLCIISEEACQASSPNVSTIKKLSPTSSKARCNYCEGVGHWERVANGSNVASPMKRHRQNEEEREKRKTKKGRVNCLFWWVQL